MIERLGVVDWGIGGFGVVRALRRVAPHVPIAYLADSGATPYGLLSQTELIVRLATVFAELERRGVRTVVVACNAASCAISQQGPAAAQRLPLAYCSMVDAAVAQVAADFSGTLGVIGGARTIRSGVYRRRLLAPGRRIVQRIAQPLSAHVEAGTGGSVGCAAALDKILAPLRGAQALLLACTHYPALSSHIAERLPGTALLDPADSVIEHLLQSHTLPRSVAPDCVMTTGSAQDTRHAAIQAWGFDPGPCERITLARHGPLPEQTVFGERAG